MRILIACEFSGVVRQAFRRRGHDAYSCDLEEAADHSMYHFQADCLDIIREQQWDMMIAHPPCTYLCSSGLHWNRRIPGRNIKTALALEFVKKLLAAPIKWIVLENPTGCISTLVRKPDQIIQPWQFGEDASKATCLWLRGLPKLEPTKLVGPRMVNGRRRWANQTDSGQNRLGPSEDRGRLRSITYQGIAEAMADQWG